MSELLKHDPYLQHEAEVVERIQESPTIFTLRLKFTDPEVHKNYTFAPGQFNMLYLYGVGEIAISIVSDPKDEDLYSHTIAVVGRVTTGFSNLKEGDRIGIRGPFGVGWPMEQAKGKDVVVITGGLGCAPVVAAINAILAHREEYGKFAILQGVKHADEFIYKDRYDKWRESPDTQVLLSSDEGSPQWPWTVGRIVTCIEKIDFDITKAIHMVCGPEIMMSVSAKQLAEQGAPEDQIYLSLERNMKCGVGHCGHCQMGGDFVCKDGPVFPYPKIKNLLGVKGF